MTESTDGWALRARLALVERSVDKDVRERVLAEVAAHCAESGESPDDAFGFPDDFAESVASEQRPDGTGTAGGDRDALTNADYIASASVHLGRLTLILGVYLAISEGLMVRLTTGALLGSPFVAAAVFAVNGVSFALNRGSRARAGGCALAALLAIGLAVIGFGIKPHSALVDLPTLALCVAGIALMAWPLFYDPSAPASAAAPEKLPSAEYLRKLPQLLEARHALPHARAHELAEEARTHVAEAGSDPEEEFGPVTAYARQLAEAEHPRQHWWEREGVRSLAGTTVAFGYLVDNVYTGGPLLLRGVAAVAVVIGVGMLPGNLRRLGGASRAR